MTHDLTASLTIPERMVRLEERDIAREQAIEKLAKWQEKATYGLIAVLIMALANLLGFHK